jgi:hypothetical protein
MPAACVIAFSILCVPWNDQGVRVMSSGFGQSVVVQAEAGDVSLEYWSDNIFDGGWDSAARICRGDRCIEYRREDKANQTLFMIRGADCDLGRRLLVTSRTAAGRDHLLATFAVIPPHGERKDAIPLAALSEQRPLAVLHEDPTRDRPPGDLECSD